MKFRALLSALLLAAGLVCVTGCCKQKTAKKKVNPAIKAFWIWADAVVDKDKGTVEELTADSKKAFVDQTINNDALREALKGVGKTTMTEAVLKVKIDENTFLKVRMIREGGKWKVSNVSAPVVEAPKAAPADVK